LIRKEKGKRLKGKQKYGSKRVQRSQLNPMCPGVATVWPASIHPPRVPVLHNDSEAEAAAQKMRAPNIFLKATSAD
jgi:hypothetical protein